jgi:hypothetical protein
MGRPVHKKNFLLSTSSTLRKDNIITRTWGRHTDNAYKMSCKSIELVISKTSVDIIRKLKVMHACTLPLGKS